MIVLQINAGKYCSVQPKVLGSTDNAGYVHLKRIKNKR